MTTEATRILIEFVPAAGKSAEAVLAKMERAVRDDVEGMQTTPADKPEPAESMQEREPCQECDGHLVVYSSKRRAGVVTQYVQCWSCEWKPKDNRRDLPAEQVPKRTSRKCT